MQEIFLFDWKEEGLKYPSSARIAKLIYIDKSQFRRYIGKVSIKDWRNIERKLKEL